MSLKFTSLLMAGTSGLMLPSSKREAPETYRNGSRLAWYSTLFNSIEMNSSFYKMPLPTTFSRWACEVQPDFRFTIKLWRGITHEPGLQFMPADVHRCLSAVSHLGEKKGSLLIQLPPGLKATAAKKLEELLDTICATDPARTWRLAVEFRHRSWYIPEIETLLHRYQAATVLHDMPASSITELPEPVPFVYLRFHGPAGDYKGGYSDATLTKWAQKATNWLSAGKEVYIYFNNTIGDALADLTRLRTMILDGQHTTSRPSATASVR